MSLEIQSYREITAYNAKVMLGMSWRQLGIVAIAMPIIFGIYMGFWWIGQDNLGTWVVAVLAIPVGLLGWVRPKGLPFEKFARYVFSHTWNSQRCLYSTHRFENSGKGKKNDKAVRKTLKRKGTFEASH